MNYTKSTQSRCYNLWSSSSCDQCSYYWVLQQSAVQLYTLLVESVLHWTSIASETFDFFGEWNPSSWPQYSSHAGNGIFFTCCYSLLASLHGYFKTTWRKWWQDTMMMAELKYEIARAMATGEDPTEWWHSIMHTCLYWYAVKSGNEQNKSQHQQTHEQNEVFW